jgi:hypothetical protein
LDPFFNYLHAVIDEANFQHSETVPTIEVYLQGRRANAGMRPGFDLALNLPDEVFYHPGVEELRDAACELVFLYNVGVSYFTLAKPQLFLRRTSRRTTESNVLALPDST